MRIKVKIFFDNMTSANKPVVDYLVGCLAQREIGQNIKVLKDSRHADIEIDVQHLETKEQAAAAVPEFEREIFDAYLKKLPRMAPGQKKVRKRLK